MGAKESGEGKNSADVEKEVRASREGGRGREGAKEQRR